MNLYYPLKSFNQKKEHGRYAIWLSQSRHDLEASFVSLNSQYYEWASYQATQSAEKALKSLIAHAGWRPPRTHKLSVLIGIANSINTIFREQKFKFRDLEIYTFISRYPFLIPGEKSAPHDYVKKHDADSCIDEAKGIMNIIETSLSIEGSEKFEDVESIAKINLDERLKFVTAKIIDLLNPDQIILFGGYARGKKTLSTLDILVIAETNLPFLERIKLVREHTKGGLPTVSPLIYTPTEIMLMLEGGEGFLENAIEEGVVLYKRDTNKAQT